MGSLDPWLAIDDETPIDPSQYRDKSIRNRKDAAKAEAESIRKAFVKYLSKKPSRKIAPFTYKWLLQLHGEMFAKVVFYGGKIRTSDMSIGVRWQLIVQELAELENRLKYWTDHEGPPIQEQAVTIHHQAVRIHPFENGNGRWARLLANIWLKQRDLPTVDWPSGLGEVSPERDRYIAAMKVADLGDLRQLAALHAEYSHDL